MIYFYLIPILLQHSSSAFNIHREANRLSLILFWTAHWKHLLNAQQGQSSPPQHIVLTVKHTRFFFFLL